MTKASLTAQAIQLLVHRRWPMLPSTGPQKKPCVVWKQFQKQLPTVEDLRRWEQGFRPQRWGVVTGNLAGIIVADFDGEQGIQLMRNWGVKPHVRTGSGGYHWYLQHPGWHVATLNARSGKASWPWPGLDIRGDGGFAVLLGRNAKDPYIQLRDLVPEPFDSLPEEVRKFLSDRTEAEDVQPNLREPTSRPTIRSKGGRRPDEGSLIERALVMVPGSGRNNSGFWLACQLRDNGYSIGEAEAAMRDYWSRVPSTNTKGKREPYAEGEIMASLGQAYSRIPREPWAPRHPHPHHDSAAAAAPGRERGRRGKDEPLPDKDEDVAGDVADDPDSIDIYVGHTGEPLVGHMGEPLSRTQFSRVPREVSEDRRLKHRDIRVYAVLAACCWQGNVSQVGKRKIASLAPCAERLVIDSLRRLETTGHIQKQPGRLHGQRGRYVLLSAVFGQKQRSGMEDVARGPNGLRLVSVRKEQGSARSLQSGPTEPRARLKY
jgi:hypothetical protein